MRFFNASCHKEVVAHLMCQLSDRDNWVTPEYGVNLVYQQALGTGLDKKRATAPLAELNTGLYLLKQPCTRIQCVPPKLSYQTVRCHLVVTCIREAQVSDLVRHTDVRAVCFLSHVRQISELPLFVDCSFFPNLHHCGISPPPLLPDSACRPTDREAPCTGKLNDSC